jgi:hypothetical protein
MQVMCDEWMAHDSEPLPLLAETPAVSGTQSSLATILNNLCDILHQVALPKTKTEKSCSFPLDVLQNARRLITDACDFVKGSEII